MKNLSQSSSSEELPADILEQIEAQRDDFQNHKDEIRKGIIEQKRYAVQRFANWRLSLANISFAVAIAIAPLLFFSSKRPLHPITFYAGVLILLLNGIIAYSKEKKNVETDLNAIGYLGKPELYYLGVFVHELNKTLYYKTPEHYGKYYDLSREFVSSAQEQINDNLSRNARTSIWNEIHLLSPLVSVYLISREILHYNQLEFYLLLGLGLILGTLYVIREYKLARVALFEGKVWDSKIFEDDKRFNEWGKDIVKR